MIRNTGCSNTLSRVEYNIRLTLNTEVPLAVSSLILVEKVEANTGGFSFVLATTIVTVVVPVLGSEMVESVASTSNMNKESCSWFTADLRLIAPRRDKYNG